MARPKKQYPAQEASAPEMERLAVKTAELIKEIDSAQPKRGDIIQVVPHDKEQKHQLMANIMIVHETSGSGEAGMKLVCYQPGKNGHPAKRVVDAVDALVVGHARLKIAEGKQLPEAERPRYDDPLDKI